MAKPTQTGAPQIPRHDTYNAVRVEDLSPRVTTLVTKILEGMEAHQYPITAARPLRLPQIWVPDDLQAIVARAFLRDDEQGWEISFDRNIPEVRPERPAPDLREGNRG